MWILKKCSIYTSSFFFLQWLLFMLKVIKDSSQYAEYNIEYGGNLKIYEKAFMYYKVFENWWRGKRQLW